MEETEDPGLLTFLQDIKYLVCGVWSLLHCFLTVSYFTGKYIVECINWFGESIWEGFCLSAEGLKALFHAVIELEESLIRGVVLVHYSIGKIFDAFEVTLFDLADFIQHLYVSQIKLLGTFLVGCGNTIGAVFITVPRHICSALVIIGDFVLEVLQNLASFVQVFLVELIWSPINVILYLSDIGLQVAALPGKILASVPFSAHVGSIVLLLVYVLYCKLSFFRLVQLLVTCIRKSYRLVKRIPHFLSQILRLIPRLSSSVAEDARAADAKGRCVVCLENLVSYLANPCNHVCLCSVCVHRLVEVDHLCPICRNPVNHYSKVYVS